MPKTLLEKITADRLRTTNTKLRFSAMRSWMIAHCSICACSSSVAWMASMAACSSGSANLVKLSASCPTGFTVSLEMKTWSIGGSPKVMNPVET